VVSQQVGLGYRKPKFIWSVY